MQTEDIAARNAWILEHRPIALSVVRRGYGTGDRYSWLDLDDLRQEAMLGLFRAYEGYDDSRGASESTYAHWHARGKAFSEMRRERGHMFWCPQDLEYYEARNNGRPQAQGWRGRKHAQLRKGWEDRASPDGEGHMVRELVADDGATSGVTAAAKLDDDVFRGDMRRAVARAEAARLLARDKAAEGRTSEHQREVGISVTTIAAYGVRHGGTVTKEMAAILGVTREALNQERRKLIKLTDRYRRSVNG